jgi:hypothetical protein
MKPVEQRVYLIVKIEDELPKPSKYLVLKENGDKDFVYTPFSKDVTHWLKEQKAFVFTVEELNEYTQNVIKQALETAADRAEIVTEDYGIPAWSANYNPEIILNKKSITNTFEETYRLFSVD